tara:strand:- start:610 stop:2430 length:1821 start_codon:yes stop_codon:yes gene_type:complete
MPQFPLGAWLPDKARINLPGLYEATNLVPTGDGYRSIRGPKPLLPLTGSNLSLDTSCRGAFRGRTRAGREFVVAADSSKLYIVGLPQMPDWKDVSGTWRAILELDRVDFALYEDYIIAVSPGQGTHIFDCQATDLASETFTLISAGASRAACVETFKGFTVLGNVSGISEIVPAGQTAEASIHWSAIDDPTSWPTIGTDAALNNQSDFQSLEGDGGRITALCSTGDWLAVLRQRAVFRADYVGGSNIMAFRMADSHRGCISMDAAIAIGGSVYFPSEEGFCRFDGANVTNIGVEQIDRTWRSIVTLTGRDRTSVAHDPETQSIIWSVPEGSGDLASVMFCYRYDIGQWFKIDQAHTCVLTAFGSGGQAVLTSLDDWGSTANITGITKTDPGVVSAVNEFSDGDTVEFSDVGGMTEINGTSATVANRNVSAGTFEIGDTSTGYSDYTSGGLVASGTGTPGLGNYYMDGASTPTLKDTNLDLVGVTAPIDEKLCFFDSSNTLQVFDDQSSYLNGTIETGDYEIPGGSRGILRWIRPVYNGSGSVAVHVAGRSVTTGDVNFRGSVAKPSVGVASVRVGGRYLRTKMTTSGEVKNIQGFDAGVEVSGGRR